MIGPLQERFGQTGAIDFAENDLGMPLVHLRHTSGHTCQIYLFGAHVVSWKTPSDAELLFLSRQSDLSGKKAIRGGIPLVFPQFGPGQLPSHGFARTNHWQVVSSNVADNGEVSIGFTLQDNSETKTLWPHTFEVTFTATLSEALSTEFVVKNLGESEFGFQNALHTYFTVGDIQQTVVRPLNHLEYLDNTKKRKTFRETCDEVTFESEVDRVYVGAPDALSIVDRAEEREFLISKKGSNDAVVWNPWIEKGNSLADLEPEGYRRFVCVETGNIAKPVVLQPTEAHRSYQTIRYRSTL